MRRPDAVVASTASAAAEVELVDRDHAIREERIAIDPGSL